MAQFMFNELLYTKTLAHPCTGTQLQKELQEEKKTSQIPDAILVKGKRYKL